MMRPTAAKARRHDRGLLADNHELLNGFRTDYFTPLRPVWESRSIELASRIVRGFFPAAQDLAADQHPDEHDVVRQSDDWLAANADAPALRRLVIEQRDHLLRALTAQARA